MRLVDVRGRLPGAVNVIDLVMGLGAVALHRRDDCGMPALQRDGDYRAGTRRGARHRADANIYCDRVTDSRTVTRALNG